MNKERESDISLVKKARKGDRQAFGELIKSNKEYFYRTAFLYTKQEEAALEVFQEAIVRALISIKKLKEPQFFKTWMVKIIYNCAMDIYRSSSKTVPMDIEQELTNTASGSDISREEKMDLHNAIRKLDGPYQEVIIKKYFEGKKIHEIAALSGRPEGTVKSDLSRAKKQLRSILREGYQHV